MSDATLDRASLLVSALDAIITIDADQRIVEYNPSAERTSGTRATKRSDSRCPS